MNLEFLFSELLINSEYQTFWLVVDLIRHPLIKRFINSGFAELCNFAKKSYDKELGGKLNIVTRFMGMVPSHIAHIRKKYIADPDLAGNALFHNMWFFFCLNAICLQSFILVKESFGFVRICFVSNVYILNLDFSRCLLWPTNSLKANLN